MLPILTEGASELGIELTQVQLERFETFSEVLRDWAERVSLTAVRDEEGIQRRHFLESAALLSLMLQEGLVLRDRQLIDVGSGSGVLRPTKALPYHPTASYCWYPDTVLALCDELFPGKPNSAGAPRMSWYGSRYPKGGVVATFPDVLEGPVTITGMADDPDARNWLSGMIIDSPFSYTFTGSLNASGDLTVTVLRGDHRWQEGTWAPSGWTPSRTYD